MRYDEHELIIYCKHEFITRTNLLPTRMFCKHEAQAQVNTRWRNDYDCKLSTFCFRYGHLTERKAAFPNALAWNVRRKKEDNNEE